MYFRGYPQLRDTGGFQILVSQEKARKLFKIVSHGSCSTEKLRCFGSGRIYIRPLQRSIPIRESMRVQEEYEVCLGCETPVAVSEMRQHQQDCVRCEVCIFPSYDENTGERLKNPPNC